jgi:hypothetical protein
MSHKQQDMLRLDGRKEKAKKQNNNKTPNRKME